MQNTQQRIREINDHGYNLDFGTTFDHAFIIYKKTAVTAGLTFLLLGFIISMILIGGLQSVIDVSNPENSLKNLNVLEFSSLGIIAYYIGIVLFTALISPLFAGLLKMSYYAETGQPFSIATSFEYFKAPYFGKILLATLIITVGLLPISLLSQFTQYPMVGAITNFAIQIFTILIIPLIIFGKLDALEAIRGSFIIVSKKPFHIFLLIFVGSLFAICGLLGCCIGVFFTLPFVYNLYYSIYVHSVGIEVFSDKEDYI